MHCSKSGMHISLFAVLCLVRGRYLTFQNGWRAKRVPPHAPNWVGSFAFSRPSVWPPKTFRIYKKITRNLSEKEGSKNKNGGSCPLCFNENRQLIIRTTGLQDYRNYRIAGLQDYRITGLQDYRNYRIIRLQEFQDYRTTGLQDYRNYRTTGLQELQDYKITGFTGLHDYMTTANNDAH